MEIKYNHQKVEANKNKQWIDNKIFSKHDKNKEPFTIILPPPNVTGKLHLGHAWDSILQDVIIRYKKLKGFDTLWIPGMDHAGIATQAKVESKLKEENISKYDLGRKDFLNKIWSWKNEYAKIIRKQWNKLGIAVDYNKERFTLDKQTNEAVNKVFIDMYNKGLIYKGKRAINWDSILQTALSDMEVISKKTNSIMWYFKYPIKDSKEFLDVATTRPETMFSDVAIAVNPKDKRFQHLYSKVAISPLTGKELPIITDEYISIEKGTGVMKVSAHSIADINIIQKNNLEIKESILKDGTMNALAKQLEGLDRLEARLKIVEILNNEGKLIKRENIVNNIGYSERTGTQVEILITDQWFVKINSLASNILKNLRTKDRVKFIPGRFKETLSCWMKNAYDWTISRQLWWGHRIPAWYKQEKIKVQVDCPGKGWIQDKDVLDTWFSSALVPFSFLGWPNNTEDIARYYPINLLVTGYDIIFFWVSRMYFQGLEFMKQIPFKEVIIHGLIRDNRGRKMSKSLGNGVDPMDIIDDYGSDSLRWFLLTNSTPGNDINYSPKKLESSWNLNNKIWNISRYILEVIEHSTDEVSDADKWILNKLSKLEEQVSKYMDRYDFTIVGKDIFNFIQNDLSSWYIEMIKTKPNQIVAKKVLKETLIIISPLLPFISEEIYSQFNKGTIFEDKWPNIKKQKVDYINDVIEVVKTIRSFRSTQKLPKSEVVKYYASKPLSNKSILLIKKLANSIVQKNNGAKYKLTNFEIFIKISINMKNAEERRIQDEIKRLEFEIKRSKNILNNKNFINNAIPSKVKEEEYKYKKYKLLLHSLMGGK